MNWLENPEGRAIHQRQQVPYRTSQTDYSLSESRAFACSYAAACGCARGRTTQSAMDSGTAGGSGGSPISANIRAGSTTLRERSIKSALTLATAETFDPHENMLEIKPFFIPVKQLGLNESCRYLHPKCYVMDCRAETWTSLSNCK